MITINNYIYTNKGIVSVQDIFNDFQNTVELPSVMSFNDTSLEYEFVEVASIVKTDDVDAYECKFNDIYSSRTLVLNAAKESEILQYNTLQTENSPIINKNFQVVKYLTANTSRSKLFLGWKALSELTNYANKSCNIGLGDTVLRFNNKMYKQKDSVYEFFNASEEKIPVFACLAVQTYYNFVLIK